MRQVGPAGVSAPTSPDPEQESNPMREAIIKTTPSAQRLKVKSAKQDASTSLVETVSADQDGQMCPWRFSDAPHRQQGSI